MLYVILIMIFITICLIWHVIDMLHIIVNNQQKIYDELLR